MHYEDPALAPFSAVHLYQANGIIRRHALAAAGSTMLWQTTIWGVASPGVTAVQLKMLADLSAHYGMPLSPDLAKPLLLSIGGGLFSYAISQLPTLLAVKAAMLSIPVVGVPLRFGIGPAVMAAFTWYLGRAFILHYEAGGTLHTFDLAALKLQLHRAFKLSPIPGLA